MPTRPGPPEGPLASWRRAGAVAGTTFAATLGAALVLAWLIATGSMTVGQVLSTAGALVAGAFGAGVEGRMGGSFVVVGGTARGEALAVPLVLTLLAATTAVLAFRRATRHGPGGIVALVDASRAACLLAAGVLVLALTTRTDSGGILVAVGWVQPRDADQVLGDAGVVAWQAPLGAFLVTFGVLATACLLRGDGWSPRVAAAAARWRPPVHGLVVLLRLVPVAGVLGLLMLAGGEEVTTGDLDVDPSSGVGLALAALANWGVAVLALGAFGPAGRTLDGQASGDLEVRLGTFHERLGHWTQQEPGLWAAVPVTLLVLLLSARAVVRAADRSGPPQAAPAALLRWLVLLAVALPALGLAARLSGTGSVVGQVWGDRGRGELAATLGVDLWPATLSLLAAGALAAALVGWRAAREGPRPDPLSGAEERRTLEETTVAAVTGGHSDGNTPPPHP